MRPTARLSRGPFDRTTEAPVTGPTSPLSRSISLWNLVRGFIAFAAVLALVAAVAAGHYALAIAGLVFFIIAVTLGYRAWRIRQGLARDTAPDRRG